MKIIYVTRHFNKSGYIILNSLINEKIKIEAVVLHKDKNNWNNKHIRPFLLAWYKVKCKYYRCKPLKSVDSEYLLAKKNSIPIIFIDSMKENNFIEKIKTIRPDLIVLGGGWHELIPETVFNLPKYGTISTHPSLLPAFRGTSITRWQILYGVKISGCTIHYVNKKFDSGEILAQRRLELSEDLTPQELFLKLSKVGADLMVELLQTIMKNGMPLFIEVSNDKKYFNYYTKWEWSDKTLKIDWQNNFFQIHCMVLANIQESYEYTGPFFCHNKNKYILRETRIHSKFKFSKKLLQSEENKIVVVKKSNGSLFLYRKDEDYILELVQLQLCDKYFKYRRANVPSHFLNLNRNDIFNI